MIQNIILDLDGTLLESKLRHYTCYQQILHKYGYQPLALDTYWQMKRERIPLIKQLAATQAEACYDKFIQDWLEIIENLDFLSLDYLYAGVIEKLQEWQNKGYQLILVTLRRHPENLLTQLSNMNLKKYLDLIIISQHQKGGVGKAQEVRIKYPDINPSQTIWIGDTEIDVEAARIFGCPIFGVTCGLRTHEYLQSLLPDFLVPSLLNIQLEDI